MGVYKNNATGKWEWKIRENGKQIKKTNKEWTRKSYAENDLRQYLLDKENAIKEGKIVDIKFKDVLNEYYDYISLSKKQSSITATRQRIDKHIKPFFGKYPINKITTNMITDWQQTILNMHIRDDENLPLLSNSYLKTIQGILRDIMKFAMLHSYIAINPLELTKNAFRNDFSVKQPMTILTIEQFELFMSVIEDKVDRAMYSILYWCGLRSGEMLALNNGDYDRQEKVIRVYKNYDPKNRILTTTKTNRNRDVQVPTKCIAEIESLLEHKVDTNPNLPLIGYAGRLSKTTIERQKKKYIELANELDSDIKLPHFTFHELRHTHVSTLISIGWKSKAIALRLGHSQHEVEETYSHLFPKEQDELFARLDNL